MEVNPVPKPICVFCNTSKEDPCNLGDLLKTGNIYAHYYCLLLSAHTKQEGADTEGIFGFLEADIRREVRGGKKRKCYKCKKFGATLKCFTTACRRTFHLPCAIEVKSRIDFFRYKTYCKYHNLTKLKIANRILKNNVNEICTICLDYLSDSKDVIVNVCCGKLLHISCAKVLALNSGYFTKCPTCNSTDKFVRHLEEMGVFVPCRDASWELEENAFQDLLFVYKHCDAETCCCPYGREYEGERRWLLSRCQYCGSSAVHKKCASVRRQYVCSSCVDKKS